MIPDNALLTEPMVTAVHPDRTYFCVTDDRERERGSVYRSRIKGFTDGIEALKQTVYFILCTERYAYPIYSWDYGVELRGLIGKPLSYVMSEAPRRVTDALLTDDRITAVRSFTFERMRGALAMHFTVVSDIGSFESGIEVNY